MWQQIPAEQFARALDECAHEVLAEAGIERPPVDAMQLAGRLRLVVARDSFSQVRARFVRLEQAPPAARGTILLADEVRPERRHWAVAHEIGECVAYRVFKALGVTTVDVPAAAREMVANRLASCLLLPRKWFSDDGRSVDWDLAELKLIYSTASHELIARRMLETSPSVVITLFDQGQPQWRKSSVLARPPRLTSCENAVWREVFETAVASSAVAETLPPGVKTVRCWPVHEPGWRREIMRTELVGW